MDNVNINLDGVNTENVSEPIIICDNKGLGNNQMHINLVNLVAQSSSTIITNATIPYHGKDITESLQEIENGETLLQQGVNSTEDPAEIPASTVFASVPAEIITQQENSALVNFKESFQNLVFTTIPSVSTFQSSLVIQNPVETSSFKPKHCKNFCVATLEEVEETIRKHSEETYSHFVVAKKTKAFGSPVSAIDLTTKFRIHWQSRDLTSTEECAVQIPYEGIPFIYIGEKAFMCYFGRCKPGKNKDIPNVDISSHAKKHRSRLVKKQGCPAKIFIKHIAKFPEFSIASNTEYLRTQTSQKLRKALQENQGELQHITQFVGTLPGVLDHTSHEIGEATPIREPIDPVIRDKIIELAWQHGEHVHPGQIVQTLEYFVEQVLFKDKSPPSKRRRRFYPNEKDIGNYIYKAKMLTKLSLQEIDNFNQSIVEVQRNHPDVRVLLSIECGDAFQSADQVTVLLDEKIHATSATSNDYRIVFCCQTLQQQRLLKRYGKQALLSEISQGTCNSPFPLFGVFVPTNVDYQLVYLFMIQSRTISSLRNGMLKLQEWNPKWCPRFLTVDYMVEVFSMLDQMFPKCSILMSESSRLKVWNEWFDDPSNFLAVNKDELIHYLENIANSHTEDVLNKAAQSLENSDIWRQSEHLRDWISTEWLSEAKRWVVGYHMEEYISYVHLQTNVHHDMEEICGLHKSHLKNKRLSEFVTLLVEKHIPQLYQAYVDRNIEDYRKQYFMRCLYTNNASYLMNKPTTVLEHLLSKIKSTSSVTHTINQIQPGIFIVQDESNSDNAYSVSFGDATSLPSCGCLDWLKYKLPCVHMVLIFQNVAGWSMDMLSPLYVGNPMLTIDFSCFDRTKQDTLLSESLQAGDVINSLELQEMTGKGVFTTKHLNLPLIGKLISPSSGVENEQGVNSQTTLESGTSLANLTTDCTEVCKELSSAINHVENSNVLQKVKLDLQFVLDDVKLELSKPLPHASNGEKRSLCSSQHTSIPNKKTNFEECGEGASAANHTEGNGTTGDVWVFDPELNVKLLKQHRDSILKGDDDISATVMHAVQKVLKHQFNHLNGLLDFELLENLCNSQTGVSNDTKILQIHRTEGNHWAASSRTEDDVCIYCCTLGSKGKIIQQVLKIVDQSCGGEKILFIERSETNDSDVVKNCGLYAIAYCVAFAFDIEARSLLFDESGMRPHLAECLEDMCFSMFPLKT